MEKKIFCGCTSVWKCAHHIGLFLAVLSILCFFGYYIRGSKELHLELLQITFPGFSGLNFMSFIIMLIESYIYGYIGIAIWHMVGCCKTGKKQEEGK